MKPEQARNLAAMVFLAVAAATFVQDFITLLGPEWGEDVAQHWVAARLFSEGTDPYADNALRQGGERFGLIQPGQASHHFLERHHYPPLGLLLGYPISLMGYGAAKVLWLIASCAAALACIPLLTRLLGFTWKSEQAWVLAACFLFFLPVRATFALGQPDVLLFGLLLAGLALDRKERTWLAGAPLALAALLKLLPAIWLLYFIARRRWKTAASTVAWAAGLTMATLTVISPKIYMSFLRSQWSFASAESGWQRYEPTNLSVSAWMFKGLAFISGGHELEGAAAMATQLLAITALAVIVWRLAGTPAQGQVADLAGMGLLCAGIALFSPLTWQHHLVVLALPLGVALRESWSTGNTLRFTQAFLIPYLLMGMVETRSPTLRMLTGEFPKAWRDAAWSVAPLMATAGIVLTAWTAWRLTGNRAVRRKGS